MKPETKRALRWLWIIPALLVAAVGAFVAWGLTPLGPSDLAVVPTDVVVS